MKANLKVFVRKYRTIIVLIVVLLALIVLPNVEVGKLQFIEHQDPCVSWEWGRPYYSDVHWYWDWFHSFEEYGQCGQSKIKVWIHIEQVGDAIPILNLRSYGERADWETVFLKDIGTNDKETPVQITVSTPTPPTTLILAQTQQPTATLEPGKFYLSFTKTLELVDDFNSEGFKVYLLHEDFFPDEHFKYRLDKTTKVERDQWIDFAEKEVYNWREIHLYVRDGDTCIASGWTTPKCYPVMTKYVVFINSKNNHEYKVFEVDKDN